MDLYNNRIRVRELLRNPAAVGVIQREFPGLLNHPMIRMAGGMPLAKIIQMSRGIVPPEKIESTLEQLRRI